MTPLFVFNPENDMALASGLANYTASKTALLLKRDLQLLPIWLADSDCYIFAENISVNENYLQTVSEKFGINAQIWKSGNNDCQVIPWGWSPAIYNTLDRNRIKCNITTTELQGIREMSSRQFTLIVWEWIKSHSENFQVMHSPKYCTTEEECKSAIRETTEGTTGCVLKTPWSCSGRGIRLIKSGMYDLFSPWIASVIKKQGGIICEAYFNKIQDFALEFYIDNDRNIEFVGYSVFKNNTQFAFSQALVASTARLRAEIEKFVRHEELLYVENLTKECIYDLVSPKYQGYIGVDMMIYQDNRGRLRIHPCVEINMRMTMGLLTAQFGRRFIPKDKIGIFQIKFHKESVPYLNTLPVLGNANISDGKLVAGTLYLSPVSEKSHYTAEITII